MESFIGELLRQFKTASSPIGVVTSSSFVGEESAIVVHKQTFRHRYGAHGTTFFSQSVASR